MKTSQVLNFSLGLIFCVGLFGVAGFASYGGNLTQDVIPPFSSQASSSGQSLNFQKPDENGKKIPQNPLTLGDNPNTPLLDINSSLATQVFLTQIPTERTTPGTLITPLPPTEGQNNSSTDAKVTIGTVHGRLIYPVSLSLPSKLMVSLQAFESGTMQEEWSTSSTVASDGSFSFSQVRMPANWVFQTRVTYNQIEFTSKVQAAFSSTDLYLPITIYATSSDPSVITIDRLHIFINNPQPNQLEITEIFILSNPSSLAIVSKNKQPILQFGLPKNASNLILQGGHIGDGRYISTNDGFGDLQTIFPGRGQTEELFSYDIPFSQLASLNLPITWPVSNVLIMVPATALSVSGHQIGIYGQQLFQGRNFKVYNASNLIQGSTLSLEISVKTPSGQENTTSPANHLIFGGSVLFIVLLIIGIFLYRYYQSQPKRRKSKPLQEDINTLIDSIVVLDNLHKAGKLSSNAYQKRRQALKQEILLRFDQKHLTSQP